MQSRASIILLLLSVLALAGCESIFGKEEGQRGYLPGTRENVFNTDTGVKPDAEIKSTVDVGPIVEKTDWPVSGGSATRLHGMVALAADPKEAWSTSIGRGSNKDISLAAKPIVVGDKVFTVDADGDVRAMSASNGGVVWSRSVPDPAPEGGLEAGSGLAFAEGKLIVTTSYGNVVALEAASGKILWQKQLPAPIRSAPFVAEGKIYVTATTNSVYELALADGTLGWNHTGLQENASLFGMASPLAADDLVIVPYSSGELYGLRKFNGRLVWEENLANSKTGGALPAMSDIQGQPVLDQDKLYVISHSGRFVALDVRTGRMAWETDLGSTQMPWVAGNSIFIVTPENRLVALAREDGRVRWSADLPRYLDEEDKTETMSWVGPVLAGGKIWVASSEGELRAIDPATGKMTASLSVGGRVFLSPIIAARTLYILTDDGTLIAFR
jgi:outer membrane protein assembly factor BamB